MAQRTQVRVLLLGAGFTLCSVILGNAISGERMALLSTDMENGKSLTSDQVFAGFGCHGQNRSPALSWRGAPKGTKSFAVMAYDPDAPTGSGWWHWVVYDIPKQVTALPADAGKTDGSGLPSAAIQGRNDFGENNFGGACPPQGHGPHRYQFTLYALDVAELPVDKTASPAMIGYMVRMHTLDKAQIEATFERH